MLHDLAIPLLKMYTTEMKWWIDDAAAFSSSLGASSTTAQERK